MLTDTIKKRILQLNKEQAVHFAWRCAVRALPFLGSNGRFDFWDTKKDRQKHIYSIFYALDINASITYGAKSAYAHAAEVAFADAADAADAAYAAYADAADAARSAADAAKSAYAAYVAYAHASTYVAADAAYAASEAAKSAAYAARNTINLETIMLRDLDTIQNQGKVIDQHALTDLYGNIWDNFQKALKSEGCAYWGRLYKSIFDNGFELDQDALKRRIDVPNEIREQGAATVANYLEELEKGATRLNEARIIILGEKGAGKTCIARRLIDPNAPMTRDNESTTGVDTMRWELELDQENINVRIWDFAGHTVTHAVHQFFLSERCLYLMVYDGRTEERNRLEYWLNHMKNFGGDSKAIILVNERDKHSVDIPINFLKEQYPIAGFYAFSIKDDKSELEGFRNDVADYIKNNPSWEKQEIPAEYYHVKDKLENLFAKNDKEKGREHITKEEFNTIAGKHDVKDIDELLKALHYLGVSLWYKDMEEFNTLVLNPEWISDGIYKIINWVSEEKKHSLTLTDFQTVFKDDENRYPERHHKFLSKLMKHYELVYEAVGGELIIPHLLDEDRPEKLPDFPVGDSLMLRYKAEQPLPPNTVSRFIVRHHEEIKQEKKNSLVWRYGVVLEDASGSIALVREEDRTISVSVKGKDKTNYISKLRGTLNDIFNSYKSEKPELQYRIERFEQIPDELEAKNPLLLSASKIINHVKDKELYYEDGTRQRIDLTPTVNLYNITTKSLNHGGPGSQFTHDESTHTTFNFNKCNTGLQGKLNELALLLTGRHNKIEAEELKLAANALEQVEDIESTEKVKKSGIANILERLSNDLNSEESGLHKAVKGIKNGVSIGQDIAKGYNSIAQWLGLPQVPTPFLK